MMEEKQSSSVYARCIHPQYVTFKSTLEAILNRPNAAGVRQTFKRAENDTRQSTMFLVTHSNGIRHSIFDALNRSAISLGKALYQVEFENGIPFPARRKRTIEALQQEHILMRGDTDMHKHAISQHLAEAIHDFSLEAYLHRKKRRERTLLVSSGAIVTLISASIAAHEWLGNTSQPETPRTMAFPTLVQPTHTITPRAIVEPTRTNVVVTPDRSTPRTASDSWASLISTYHLDVPLPNGRIPIKEIGNALSDDALPQGQGNEIRSAILSFVRQFNVFSNGKAAVDLGGGGETIVTSEKTKNGIQLVVDDLAPIPPRSVSYDTISNVCTVSYTDNSGDTKTTTIILDPHDPEKLCVFTMSTRKQTIGAIRLNSNGIPEVYVVITTAQ